MRATRSSFVAFATLIALSLALLAARPAAALDYGFEFGGPGSPEEQRLLGADGIAVDADGNPWVADNSGNKLVKYTYDGRFIAAISAVGTPSVALSSPRGIAADAQGSIYVAYDINKIARLDTGGELRGTIQPRRTDGTRINPAKIAVSANGGRIYVSEGINTIYALSRRGREIDRVTLSSGWTVTGLALHDGELLASFRTSTVDQGGVAQFPPDLSGEPRTTIFNDVAAQEVGGAGDRGYLADYKNSRVIDFPLADGGDPTAQFGTRGIGAGQMNGPWGIATDCRGNVYVLDTAARYDGPGGPLAGGKVLKYSASSAPPPCEPPRPLKGLIDTQINDVEVTQAIQPAFTHTAGPFLAPGEQAFTLPENQPRSRAYGSAHGGPTGEVPLKAALATVVRVYANLNQGPAGGIANVPATLEGFSGSRSLGTIQPVGRPALLENGSRTVDPALRTTPNVAYSFAIPDAWTRRGTIDLLARVNPASIGCDSQCVNRSTFRLTGLNFGITRVAPIEPVALTDNGQLPVSRPMKAFEPAKRVTPLLLDVHGYRAQAEVGDLIHAESITVERCFLGVFPCSEGTYVKGSPKYREYLEGELFDRLERVADDADIDNCEQVPIGLINGINGEIPGAMRGEFLAAGLLPCAIGYATVARPFTAVAHELQHAFGRPHAGQDCPDTRPGDDQEGESWPPDQKGFLDGIGLNTTQRSTSDRGPFAIIAPGVEGKPGQLYDLMSYCAGSDDSTWISARGWGALSNWRVRSAEVRSRGVLRSALAEAGDGGSGAATTRAVDGQRVLRVTAIETSDGELGITAVSPADASEPAGPASSPYLLMAMREDGTVLAEQRVVPQGIGDGPGKLIAGTVAAPEGTTQVFLRREGEAGTRWVGSPNPPTVKVKSPKPRSKVKGRSMKVGWKSSDPDGGELVAKVEFSPNGKRWKTVFIGPDAGSARVQTSLLSGSKKARVRVTIDDGLNAAAKTSKRFTVVPPAPQVTIEEPAGKLKIGADSPLVLRGGATGAGGRPLKGKSLVWSDGRRKLGKGPSVLAAGLRPGKHRIQLSAKQSGKAGRASVQVQVRAVKPAFLLLKAPTKLGKRARSAKLRVASTVAASLKVGRKRFAVSVRPRAVKVPVKRGKGAAKLKLQLLAGKKKTTQKLTIPRR